MQRRASRSCPIDSTIQPIGSPSGLIASRIRPIASPSCLISSKIGLIMPRICLISSKVRLIISHICLIASLVLGMSRIANAQSSDPSNEAHELPPIASREVVVEGTRLIGPRDVSRLLQGAEVDVAARLLERLGQRLTETGLLEARLDLDVSGDPIRLNAEEGPFARWDSLAVFVRAAEDVPVGAPRVGGEFSLERFDRAIERWVEDWAEAGYPFAIATVESIRVESGLVRAGVRCDPGQRAVVAEVEFPGASGTRGSFLERWVRFRPQRLYRESRLQQEQRRLEQSGLFLSVDPPELELLGDGTLRVRYPVREGPHNRAEGAVGYAGASETVSGFASLRLGNLFGTGRRLSFRWERAAAEQSLFDLGYREPLVLGYPLALDLAISQEVQDSTYTLDRMEAGLELGVGVDLFVSAGLEMRRAVLGSEPSEVVRRSSTVFGARYEGQRTGWRGARAGGTFRTGQSRIDPPGEGPKRRARLERAEADAEAFWKPGPLVVRGRGAAGALSGAAATDPSLAEALWVGGATTVRGLRERALATRRFGAAQLEVGAPFLLEEGRAYLFFDACWFRLLQDQVGVDSRYGWGVGMAARTGRQTIALDLGVPGTGGFSEARIHLHLETAF